MDTQDDVEDVSTHKYFDTTTKTCKLEATFDRKLYTGDTTQDYNIRDGDTFDAIWAWGYIQSDTP